MEFFRLVWIKSKLLILTLKWDKCLISQTILNNDLGFYLVYRYNIKNKKA